MSSEHAGHDHVLPIRLYMMVFAILMVGTAVTVWAAQIDMGSMNIVVAMLIALVKAAFVVLYFMHLRYSHRLNWVFGAAAIFWLALLIGITMADVFARSVE